MIGWLLETVGKLKYSSKTAFIRKYTNLLYYNPNTMLLSVDKIKVIEVGGCKFYPNEALEGLTQMDGDPWLAGTRPSDVVLDLGAHVGIMCIPLAKKVREVYAIEPLYFRELKQNLELNDLHNVEVWRIALGGGGALKLRYHEREGTVPTMSLSTLKDKIGQIDFLKMNCEGGEWSMSPWELLHIREIRLDYHVGRTQVKRRDEEVTALLNWLRVHNYGIDVRYINLGLHPQHRGFYRIMASAGAGRIER